MSRCMPTSHHSTSRDTNEINTAGYAAYHIILFYRRGDSVLDSIVEPAYGLWGGGVASRNLNYKESETETGFIPFIFGGYGSVFIETNRAGVTFYHDGSFFASVIGQLRTHQFRDADDNLAFAAAGCLRRA